ncbi:hypothetical protein V6N11_019717 [Hibiscus sabdariffa]|uniref:Uncharacterized protein n=1 Tax=Hibiscus sabdariffa TaxID=183260 RepID=A0ABR2NLQ2_9ROSI
MSVNSPTFSLSLSRSNSEQNNHQFFQNEAELVWHRRCDPPPSEPLTIDDCQGRRAMKIRAVGGEAWSMVLVKGWCQSIVGSEVFDRAMLGGRDSMREMNDGDGFGQG